MDEIKEYLDGLVERNNTEAFIKDDPVQFPHRYSNLRDVEIVAFLVATIAWGNRKMILNIPSPSLGDIRWNGNNSTP